MFTQRHLSKKILYVASSSPFSAKLATSFAFASTFVQLARISPAVLKIINKNNEATTPTATTSASSLDQNEQRELALIQRFQKMDIQKRNTALLSLCSTGAFEIVPFALAAAAAASDNNNNININSVVDPKSGATPFFFACARGHVECAQKFLDVVTVGGNDQVKELIFGEVKRFEKNKETGEEKLVGVTSAFQEAIKNGESEIVDFLLSECESRQIDLVSQFNNNNKALGNILFAAVQSGEAKTVKSLLAFKNGSVFASDKTIIDSLNGPNEAAQYTPFWFACMQGNAEIVDALLDASLSSSTSSSPLININFKTPSPQVMSGLAIATMQGHVAVVRTLLSKRTTTTTANSDNNDNNKFDLDVNCKSVAFTSGEIEDTPLIIAIRQAGLAQLNSQLKAEQERYEEIARMLIEEPSCRIDEGRKSDDMTPLLMACYHGNEKIVAALIERSVQLSPCNPTKKLDLTKRSSKTELTPMLAAVYNGNENVVTSIVNGFLDQRQQQQEKNNYNDDALEKFSDFILQQVIPSTRQNILHVAVSRGHEKLLDAMIKKLVFPKLSAGADPLEEKSSNTSPQKQFLEAETVDFVTPLLFALHKRSLACCESLLDAGCETEHRGVNLAGVCESEEGMEEYAKLLRRAEILREIAKKKKLKEQMK